MASCVLSHTPFFLPPLSSLFVQQEVGFAVRYTKPSVKNMETVNNAHRGWNDLLRSLFKVRTIGWVLGEQPKPQSCSWLNQTAAFPFWHGEWCFAEAGSRVGCPKAEQMLWGEQNPHSIGTPGLVKPTDSAQTKVQGNGADLETLWKCFYWK